MRLYTDDIIDAAYTKLEVGLDGGRAWNELSNEFPRKFKEKYRDSFVALFDDIVDGNYKNLKND